MRCKNGCKYVIRGECVSILEAPGFDVIAGKANCGEPSYVCATEDDGDVCLDVSDALNERALAYLAPVQARALAAQLLKAARWAEGDRT